MKKIILASLAIAMASTSTLAVAKFSFSDVNKHLNTQNLYVQGDVGYSKLEFKHEIKVKDDSTAFRVAVGKDIGTMRYAVDYTNFGKVKNNDKEVISDSRFEEYDYKTKAQSLGFSAIYDFKKMYGLTPYVGGRLGVNQLKVDYTDKTVTTVNYTTTTNYDIGSEKKTQVGIGVLAGVQYSFAQNLAVDAGVEYNYLGKVEDVKANQYGVKVGLRYNF